MFFALLILALFTSAARVEGPGPQFGSSISINEQGTVAVVGSAAAVSGFSGSFSVFTNNGSGWYRHPDSPFRIANDLGPYLGVGYSNVMDVAIWDTTIVCGAPNSGYASGSVSIFDFDGSTWTETVTIYSPAPDAWFGFSVSIYNDTIAVGAPMYGTFHGAVWVLHLDAGGWTVKQMLQGSGSNLYSQQGIAVAVWDSTIVASGPYDDYYSGSLWVFERSPSGWYQYQDKLGVVGMDIAALGHSVSMRDGTIVAGAWVEDIPFTIGATYVFDKQSNGTWTMSAKLVGSDCYPGQRQGTGVSLRDNKLAVSSATGPIAGYLFERNGSEWRELRTLHIDAYSGVDLGQNTPGKSVGLAPNSVMIGEFPEGDNGALWILE
mgnify:CR=1 FL=1